MGKCKPMGWRSTGPEEFKGSFPHSIITSTGPGSIAGTAKVACVYRMPIEVIYLCCGKWLIPIPGFRYRVLKLAGNETRHPIQSVSMPLPLHLAPLGHIWSTIADILGVGVNMASWWIEPKAADAECASHSVGEQTIRFWSSHEPECDDDKVTLPDGHEIEGRELIPFDNPPEGMEELEDPEGVKVGFAKGTGGPGELGSGGGQLGQAPGEGQSPESSSSCYIATACYGDHNAPEVRVLRKFRDEVLLQSGLGRLGVRMYYFISPPVARRLKHHLKINAWVRSQILDRMVKRLEE